MTYISQKILHLTIIGLFIGSSVCLSSSADISFDEKLEAVDSIQGFLKTNDFITTSQNIRNKDTPPTAHFTFEPNEPNVHEIVSFNSSLSSDPDGEIMEWFWDFGDGYFSNLANPMHIYQRAGIYLVTLHVTDNDEESDSSIKQITILSNIMGDLNGDGDLNSADVRFLAKYLTGDPAYQPFYSDGDANSDGRINSADVRYLAMYLVGDPGYTPLYP